ncbi:MAG: GTPase ObgE [Opitutaceae bacterium]|jgi:GTP-binding protein|nr:GTPase ObgE [Opitutaceae bacterium]
MFVDECVINVQAGDGGAGAISFRREKYEPWGGPNGGDGGRGGDIVLLGDDDTDSLLDFKYRPRRRAENGGAGAGRDRNGREGKSEILRVPPGTVVSLPDGGGQVAEVTADGQRLVLCKGGNGGWGNSHFKSPVNRAPRRANPGQPGAAGVFRLELKSIADIGLVGFPNAGKSSLTGRLTRARPRAAPYPFTTLRPQIGVLPYPDTHESLLLADVPGLVEGASENKGLGHRFLRHIERCRLLALLLDMAGTDGRDPRDDYAVLLRELEAHDPALLAKPRLVIANKMDLPAAAPNLAKFRRRHKKLPVLRLSCLTGAGLAELKAGLRDAFIAAGGKPRPAGKASPAA